MHANNATIEKLPFVLRDFFFLLFGVCVLSVWDLLFISFYMRVWVFINYGWVLFFFTFVIIEVPYKSRL